MDIIIISYLSTSGTIKIADIALYDSMKDARVYPEIERQLRAICPLDQTVDKKSKKLRILIKKTQNPKKDLCGYFAAAHATSICNLIDPELLEFDKKKNNSSA